MLDANYDVSDVDADSYEQLKNICKTFIQKTKSTIEEIGFDADELGHELWLTSQGHGSGFFDNEKLKYNKEDLAYNEKALSILETAAKEIGDIYLYANNGKVYAEGKSIH